MKHQKYIGMIIVLIMFFSVGGYAALNPTGATTNQPTGTQDNQNRIEIINDVPLSALQKSDLLRSGYSIISYHEPPGCSDCIEEKSILENFILGKDFSGFIVMETIQDNKTTTMVVGGSGKIIELGNITEENLVETFCKNSLVKPKICLLRDI